jgi:NAD(P)H dehydrogenase (quinone)
MDDARFAQTRDALGRRLDELWSTRPIRYRRQNAGDYDIPECTLKEDVLPGRTGLGVHVVS